MNIFIVLVGALFSDPAPSLRIRALGPDMAYYITDTLTDILMFPSAGHGRFACLAAPRKPNLVLSWDRWVARVSHEDDLPPSLEYPINIDESLYMSYRMGKFCPYLFTGFNARRYDYCYYYIDSYEQISGFIGGGVSLSFGRFDASLGAGYQRTETKGRYYSEEYDYMYILRYSESHNLLRFLLRGQFGQDREYTSLAGFRLCRTPAFETDTGIKLPDDLDDIRPDTIVFEREDVDWEYRLHIGLVREIELGQDARFWVGGAEEFGLEKGLYGLKGHINRFKFPAALEVAFGSQDKRFLFRLGGAAVQEIGLYNFFEPYFSFRIREPYFRGSLGFGLLLYGRLSLDANIATDCSIASPDRYDLQAVYRF